MPVLQEVPDQAKMQPHDLQALLQAGLVIRYVEMFPTDLRNALLSVITYRMDLVAPAQADKRLNRYLWITYIGCQRVQDGVRGTFSSMRLDLPDPRPLNPSIASSIISNWSNTSMHWLRNWRFVGVTTHPRRGGVIRSDLVHPPDFWVRRTMAIVLGMLFQAKRSAHTSFLASALGEWIAADNREIAHLGIRP
ncbi:MAG: hypothetical protein V1778_00410 [bacterium]